jgi:hypothetical protein
LAQAVRAESQVTVPLHLHHRLLLATDKKTRARRLVDEVAARLSRPLRRRFLGLMRKVT